MKSGFSENDANSLLESCMRYGVAQFIKDSKGKAKEQEIKIRPLEPKDITLTYEMVINKIPFNEWNFSLQHPPKEFAYYLVKYNFWFWDKVVIIFGLEDVTVTQKKEEYPISQISIERSNVKVIDIVDVQDLYHTNHVSFLTPVLYRNQDAATIKIKTENPISLNLKLNGLVFFK